MLTGDARPTGRSTAGPLQRLSIRWSRGRCSAGRVSLTPRSGLPKPLQAVKCANATGHRAKSLRCGNFLEDQVGDLLAHLPGGLVSGAEVNALVDPHVDDV